MISRLLWPPLEQVAVRAMALCAAWRHGFPRRHHAAARVDRLPGRDRRRNSDRHALARVRLFNRLIEPIFVFGYPIPKISLYPMFIFIFGFGDMSKIVLVFLECLYPITVQTMAGMRNAERVLVWAARNAGASRSADVLARPRAVGGTDDFLRHSHRASGRADRDGHHRDHRREQRSRLCGRLLVGLVRAGARHGGLRGDRRHRLHLRSDADVPAPPADLLAEGPTGFR